jgi:hypothetical protein
VFVYPGAQTHVFVATLSFWFWAAEHIVDEVHMNVLPLPELMKPVAQAHWLVAGSRYWPSPAQPTLLTQLRIPAAKPMFA